MSVFFKSEDRRIIPRLRSLKLSASTGELNIDVSKNEIPFRPSNFLFEQQQSWNRNPTLVNASDLLSSAFVLGLENHYKNIAEYILNLTEDNDSPIVKLSKKVLGLSNVEHELIPSGISNNRNEIRVLKHSLILEPKNPIAWMEIGRLYSLEGNVAKASTCVENALYLDKNNRFIVRSASRFFHHFGQDKERSIYIIKKSEYAQHDPWMISAEIAYSTILGRHSKFAKLGESQLKSGKFNNKAISELASALGTLEFNSGKIKDARRYLNQSLLAPNDNSLAQVIWMSEKVHGLSIEEAKYDLPLAFEAKAKHYYQNKDFKSSFEEALRWHADEPYSTRPIKWASYICGLFLKDYKKSVGLIKKALQIVKSDTILINNLIYFLVQDDQIEEAVRIFNTELRDLIETSNGLKEQVFFLATAGLIAYKTNNPSQGKLYYEEAIHKAWLNKDYHYLALATTNYVKEALLYTSDGEGRNQLIKRLEKACKGNNELDVQISYQDVINSL